MVKPQKIYPAGEMMVGPRLVMMMDDISTGLDSSTTFQMVQCLRHMAHLQRATICVALLQPAPEVFDQFDDIMVLAEGAFCPRVLPSSATNPKSHASPDFADGVVCWLVSMDGSQHA